MNKAEMLKYIDDRFARIQEHFPEVIFLTYPETKTRIAKPFIEETYDWLREICTGPLKKYIVLLAAHPPEFWEELFNSQEKFEEVEMLKKARHAAYLAISKKSERPIMLRKSYGKAKLSRKKARGRSGDTPNPSEAPNHSC